MVQTSGTHFDTNARLIRSRIEHDLRSGLNIILGYSAMLREELLDHGLAQAVADVDFIGDAGREILRLQRQMEDLERLGANVTCAGPGMGSPALEMLQNLGESLPRHELCFDPDASFAGEGYYAVRLVETAIMLLVRLTPQGSIIHIGQPGDAALRVYCEAGHYTQGDRETLAQRTAEVWTMTTSSEFDAHYVTVLCARLGWTVTLTTDVLGMEFRRR